MRLVLQSQLKTREDSSLLDRLGIFLSALCMLHCLVTPFLILSLPIMARYYLLHPYFHFFMAAVLLPLGLFAFARGYRYHHNKWVWIWGLPGLFLVVISPFILHEYQALGPEPLWISVGSVLLVAAHWKNQQSCNCAVHQHR
ncbi:MAG: MerC domain-containing protein [Bdellovibrio sp.]|jgi:hypothetical protein